MDKASEAILALKPVIFQLQEELDAEGVPAIWTRGRGRREGKSRSSGPRRPRKTYSVRYDAVNATLADEFLKEDKAFIEEQRKVQEQVATIARLQKQVETLAAGLQKMSAHLELSRPALQTVANQ